MKDNLEREASKLRNKSARISLSETLKLVEDMGRRSIIQKPGYRIVYSYPSPIYSFSLHQ